MIHVIFIFMKNERLNGNHLLNVPGYSVILICFMNYKMWLPSMGRLSYNFHTRTSSKSSLCYAGTPSPDSSLIIITLP